MNILFMILYGAIFLALFVGIIFLQSFLTKKHILLRLIFPLISLCYSIIIDIEIISAIYNFYLGPRTIEQYKNGLLISKSTIVTTINLPTDIFILIISNILTIILFIIFFADRKKIWCKKELNKISINDLE
jgi:TctA family transporter